MILRFVRWLSSSGRARKRAILLTYDAISMVGALWAAFSVRLGDVYVPDNASVILAAIVPVAAGLIALQQLQIYRIVLRYFDLRAATRILLASVIAAAAWVMMVYYARTTTVVDGIEILVPRSVGFVYCGFLFTALFMGRYLMALLVREAEPVVPRTAGRKRANIAIYGANQAGISLADSVRKDANYRLCAFIDDDRALAGQNLAGTRIYGTEDLADVLEAEEIQEVFLAMPNAPRAERLAAIERLNRLDIKVRTVPAPEEIVSGRFTVSDVRPVDVNDLLRRDTVEPVTELLRDAVHGRSILVTGAGGSIGSEICRQILREQPKTLVLLDHSEFSLFTIEQQLLETSQLLAAKDRPHLVPIVGSMLNETLVDAIIRKYGIDTIYHAAAYKHVPLLEHNEVIAVQNNVLGSLILARAAREHGLLRFIMVSTDKAVRPTSVMGASKRVAELIVQALAREANGPTRFGIVRFGNVLDSSGSVVQRFREQIRQGGPLTVTHPEVTRYFMSIPEATQLVLHAGAMAADGAVFVLDMGEAIRIAELARHMISLSGMTVRDSDNPDGDLEIIFIGLRPGEKLFEELFVGEETLPTAHPRIRMAQERHMAMEELEPHLEALKVAIRNGDAATVRAKLQELIEADKGVLLGDTQ